MKIIKKGTKTLPDKKIYIIKCKTCGCVFTYEEKDMCYVTWDAIGIFCPECKYSNVPLIRRKYKGDGNNIYFAGAKDYETLKGKIDENTPIKIVWFEELTGFKEGKE